MKTRSTTQPSKSSWKSSKRTPTTVLHSTIFERTSRLRITVVSSLEHWTLLCGDSLKRRQTVAEFEVTPLTVDLFSWHSTDLVGDQTCVWLLYLTTLSDDLDHLKKHPHLRYAVIDYARLGLHTKIVRLRLSAANVDYSLCPTYPANLIVPSETNESELAKVAKGFVEHRLPVVVWMNENGSLLVRASAFTSTDMVKKIKKVVNYRRAVPKLSENIHGSQQTLNSKASSNDESSSVVVAGAEIKSAEVQVNKRRGEFSSNCLVVRLDELLCETCQFLSNGHQFLSSNAICRQNQRFPRRFHFDPA